ncbi:MAG: hypothetical protein HYZ95_02155 [Candidatus Omnitrophica bacterium]|nr:hypothetical protein [Candidatus Omnitrophota bacterium]
MSGWKKGTGRSWRERMNVWARKTARIAQGENYLDRIQEVYPSSPKLRVVAKKALEAIEAAHQKKDRVQLLNLLLDQERFPFDDSYVQFLRVDRGAIRRNPETVERICNALFEMGIEGILKGVTAPVVANRRRGSQFKQWAKANFPYVGQKEFESSKNRILFLDGGERELRDYANRKFGAGLRKRPDFVAKSGSRYVVGEAKFLSSEGGEQRGGFEDAVTVAAHPAGGAVKVSILDGIVWLESRSGFYQFIQNSSINVFSALLLAKFLEAI